ncbi:MAG: hypothetical protein D6805_07515 [Planctomycetota bacterium]|nr:MAG: hypothetical protein D6805_07515 [Planctomycetota bacterium]
MKSSSPSGSEKKPSKGKDRESSKKEEQPREQTQEEKDLKDESSLRLLGALSEKEIDASEQKVSALEQKEKGEGKSTPSATEAQQEPTAPPQEEERESTLSATSVEASTSTSSERLYFSHRLIFFVILLAASCIFIELHFLNARHRWRWDLTRYQRFSLSEKTIKILQSLKSPLKFIVLVPQTSPLGRNLKDLLEEFSLRSSKISIEYVDLLRNPAVFRAMKEKYRGITPRTALVVELGHKKKYFSEIDLRQGWGQKALFKGEEAIASALIYLSQEKKPTVYFTTGHGERELSQARPTSLLEAVSALELNHFAVKELALEEKDIPSDCDILAIVGPQRPFSSKVEDKILRYLQKGGRLFLTVEPGTKVGLSLLLRRYGIRLLKGVLAEPELFRSLSLETTEKDHTYIICKNFSSHPITAPLKGLATSHIYTRPLELSVKDVKKVTADILLKTSPKSYRKILKGYFWQKIGSPQSWPIAIAAVRQEKNNRSSRLVVFGDTSFVNNGYRTLNRRIWGIHADRNLDLFLNSLHWLAERYELLALGKKPLEDRRLDLQPKDLRLIFMLTFVFPPLLGIFLGISIWNIRRS